MDVTTINTAYKPAIHMPGLYQAEKAAVEIPAAQKGPKIEEKVMMDLKDVQNFLYMLIGSEIRVESDRKDTGANFNAAA